MQRRRASGEPGSLCARLDCAPQQLLPLSEPPNLARWRSTVIVKRAASATVSNGPVACQPDTHILVTVTLCHCQAGCLQRPTSDRGPFDDWTTERSIAAHPDAVCEIGFDTEARLHIFGHVLATPSCCH